MYSTLPNVAKALALCPSCIPSQLPFREEVQPVLSDPLDTSGVPTVVSGGSQARPTLEIVMYMLLVTVTSNN